MSGYVMVDPESREHAERFARGYLEVHAYSTTPWEKRDPESRDRIIRAVQAGFRAVANPPKPPEPTGLGAVVEDARGDFWVYTGLRNAKDGETRLWFHGSLPADYADIAAVKVLSEGIQS